MIDAAVEEVRAERDRLAACVEERIAIVGDLEGLSVTTRAQTERLVEDFGPKLGSAIVKGRAAGGRVVTLTGGDAQGMLDGTARTASFGQPSGVVELPDGRFVVSDQENHSIRLVGPTGNVTTLVGLQGRGWKDGPVAEVCL